MTANTPHLSVRSSEDLIEVVPLLFGYTPNDSLVALYLDADQQVEMGARIDLSLDPADLADMLRALVNASHNRADHTSYPSLLLIAFSDDTDTADHTLLFLADNWTPERVRTTTIRAMVSVSADSWADIHLNPTLRPDRTPRQDTTSALAAEAVLAGLFTAYHSREEVAASITAPQPEDAAAFAAQMQAITGPIGREDTTAWLDDWISAGYPPLNDRDAAELAAAVQNVDVRDTAWLHISTADADHHADLWRQVAVRIDGPTALPVLGLLTAAAWIAGNGTLARIALDRGTSTDTDTDTDNNTGTRQGSGYPMFALLETVLHRAVPPAAWPQLRDSILNDPQHQHRDDRA